MIQKDTGRNMALSASHLTSVDSTEMQTPRIFIGLPVYNGARFLSRSIDSLLSQSFSDFTLLISDNASSDETQAICERYCAQDRRVRYFRQVTNIGAPGNWNFVANQAEGEYFKWATANDECAPQMLERCILALDNDPSAVLCQGRTCLVDEETDAREPYGNDLDLLEERPSDRLRNLSMRLALNNGQCGLIRLSSLRRTGLDRPYPGGDIPLMAELALIGRFIVLPDMLFYRRMGPSTFSRFLRKEQIGTFYGEQATSKTLAGHVLHQHLSILNASLRLPLEWGEKLVAANVAIRWMAWNRDSILEEIRETFRAH